MLNLAALTDEITRNESVDDGASKLIAALASEVEANKDDPTALQSLVDRLRASNDKLAAAVASVPGSAPTPAPVVDPTQP
jgi:hypothetical protein